MKISFLEIYTLIAVFHCFVLSLIILFSKFYRSATNKYLGFSLLIISVVGLNNWFWDNDQHPLFIQIFDLPLWQFLYPVTLLIFFIEASRTRALNNNEKILLFAPFIVLSVINLVVSLDNIFNIIILPIPEKEFYIFLFYKIISFLSIVFYLLFAAISFPFVFLKKTERQNKWLKRNWIFISFLILFGAVLESFRLVYGPKESVTYLWVLISVFSYWFIFHGLYRFKLSNERYEIRQLLKTPKNVEMPLYEDQTPSSLSTLEDVRATDKTQPALQLHEDQTSTYLTTLDELISTEKIHLNPGLSRDDVAEKLGISGGYLSQLLNSKGQRSFSDYINFFRVEEVKKMMENPEFDKYTLLSIGLEAGFNSKSTFYSSFKKETGMTPSEYKKHK